MRRVTIVRCPKCGCTDAGEIEAQSAYDFTYMKCNNGGCGYGALFDVWQIKLDWNVEIELDDDATALPPFVAPLRDDAGA